MTAYTKNAKAREQKHRKAKRQLRKRLLRRNTYKPFVLTLVMGIGLAILVYTEATFQDGFDSEEVYQIQNIQMRFKTEKGYEAKLLTSNPSLTIYGDEKKVQQLKQDEVIPEVTLDVHKTEVGTYEIVPKVEDTLINVQYRFAPEAMEVELFQAERHPFTPMERFYGVAPEGYYIERLQAKEQAEILVTSDELLEIGYVVVDMDSQAITQSGTYEGQVVILDKKGSLLDFPVVKERVAVEVTLSPLSWYQRQQDVEALQKEIQTLEQELTEKRQLLPSVTDLMQRTDLEKEISFREIRLPMKREELLEKEKGLSALKEQEEQRKKEEARQALQAGGAFKSEDILSSQVKDAKED